MSARERLAAAEATLAAHHARADVLRRMRASIEAQVKALSEDIKAIDTELSTLGLGWGRHGAIQSAEAKIATAKIELADEMAPKVMVESYGSTTEWALVSATAKQVKARRAGSYAMLFTKTANGGWANYAGTLHNYDHAAAMEWYAASKKAGAK